MAQIKQEKNPSTGFWHIVQVIVMILTFGFVFPNVLTESKEKAKKKPAND